MSIDSDILQRYNSKKTARDTILEKAELAAALTRPQTLRPQSDTKTSELTEAYQSVGNNGVTTFSSKMLMNIFPPEIGWFAMDLAAHIKYAPDVDDGIKQVILNQLFLTEVAAVSILESSKLSSRPGQVAYNFRSQQFKSIIQSVVTGDALQKLTNDYRIRLYTRHNYITSRDSTGIVLFHITKENVDPLNLSEAQLTGCDMKAEDLRKKNPDERLVDIYTLVQWHPDSKKWVTRQECEGKVLLTKDGEEEIEEDISPYFSIPYDLSGEDDYGRGLAEQNLGELRSLNELEYRRLQLLGLAAAVHPAIDIGSQVTPKQLVELEPGEPLSNVRVSGGEVQDLAWFGYKGNTEYSMLVEGIRDKRQLLAQSFQSDTSALPSKDRVTRAQIDRIGGEMDARLGGAFSFIAENLQIPLVHRTLHQMRRDNLMPMLTEDHFELTTQTGLAALANQQGFNRTMQLVQVMSQLGPKIMERVNPAVLVSALTRQARITEPGLIYSEEEFQQLTQQAAEEQQRQAAAAKATDVIGNIAEERSKQEIAEQSA